MAELIWLTPDELNEVAEQLEALLATRHRERRDDPAARPATALPVELLTIAYPIAPEATES